MQIQPSIAAGGAAGSVSQASSKDRASSAAATEAVSLPTSQAIEQVARSEQTSADRDAEGALYDQAGNGKQHPPAEPHQASGFSPSGLPVMPPEPPGLLDLVG